MNDKKAKHLIDDIEKVWVFWVEDETRHKILLSQSLIQNSPNCLQFHEGLVRWRNFNHPPSPQKMNLVEFDSGGLKKETTFKTKKYKMKKQLLI